MSNPYTQDIFNAICEAKLDLSDDARTIELKNWLSYLKN